MKQILLSILLISVTLMSKAQEVELPISPLRFQGVHDLTGPDRITRGYYVVYRSGSGEWTIDVVDASLQPAFKSILNVPSNAFFNDVAYDGSHILVCFVEASFKREITYVTIDSKGQEVARDVKTKVPFLNQGERFYPKVWVHPNGGFVITELVKEKKNSGVQYEYVDGTLAKKWAHTEWIDKGTLQVYEAAGNNHSIVFIQGHERSGNTLSTSAVCLSAADGNLIYKHQMTTEDEVYFPSAIHLSGDGVFAASGIYYNGDAIRGKNAKGMFFITLSPQGNVNSATLADWKTLRPTMQTEVNSWFLKVNPTLWIHHLEKKSDGSYTVLGELFRYRGEFTETVPGSSDKAIYHRNLILDFITFEVTPDAMITSVHRIARPHMLLKNEKPDEFTSDQNSFEYIYDQRTSQIDRFRALKKYGGLSFRHASYTGDQTLMMSFMQYEAAIKYGIVINALQPTNIYEIPLTKSKPKWFSVGELMTNIIAQYDAENPDEVAVTRVRFYDESDDVFSGIKPANGRQVLIYEYLPLKGKLYMNLVDTDEL